MDYDQYMLTSVTQYRLLRSHDAWPRVLGKESRYVLIIEIITGYVKFGFKHGGHDLIVKITTEDQHSVTSCL